MRVRTKSFVFCDAEATHLSVKLPKAEAAAVVASTPGAEVVEMVRTSYTLVAADAG